MSASKFKQISCIDIQSLGPKNLETLQLHSESPIFHATDLKNVPANSDALLVSLLVPITKEDIQKFVNLRYIGIYGTSKRRIDLSSAQERSIEVRSVEHYCDFETAEAIVNYLLMYFRKTGDFQNGDRPIQSLAEKKLGIIGLGHVGKELAKLAKAFQMQVSYYSPHRKNDFEKIHQIQFKDLNQILSESDVISLHTPPNQMILDENSFEKMKAKTLIINTCPGEVMDWKALHKFIDNKNGKAIFDHFVRQNLKEVPNAVSFMKEQAYRTQESIQRLSEKFLKNIGDYLDQKS